MNMKKGDLLAAKSGKFLGLILPPMGTEKRQVSLSSQGQRPHPPRSDWRRKIDTRLSMPPLVTRPPRKRGMRSSALRTFLTRLEKETWQQRPRGTKKGSGSRPLPKYVRYAPLVKH